VQEQEYEGGPSAAELQEKLTLASGDALETLNGRLPIDAAPVKSLNGKASVFDDF